MKKVFKTLAEKLKLDKLIKKILGNFNFNLHKKLNGKKFIIPIIKNIGYSNLLMDDGLWIVDILKKILPIKSDAFIDIGINIGQTLIELRSISDSIKYIGFEPNPNCIFYCNNLIKKNNFKNSLVVPIGFIVNRSLSLLTL